MWISIVINPGNTLLECHYRSLVHAFWLTTIYLPRVKVNNRLIGNNIDYSAYRNILFSNRKMEITSIRSRAFVKLISISRWNTGTLKFREIMKHQTRSVPTLVTTWKYHVQ